MKTQNFLFALAIIILVAVLADLYLWFSVSGDYATFEESRAVYLEHYPQQWRNARWLTAISILLLTFCGFIFLNLRKNRALKRVASLLGLVCAVLLIWKIFSLM